MYGKKRIVFSKGVHGVMGNAFQKGGKGSAHIGIWFRKDGKYYADLRTAAQEYKRIKIAELGIKNFGGTATKQELRNLIAKQRKLP